MQISESDTTRRPSIGSAQLVWVFVTIAAFLSACSSSSDEGSEDATATSADDSVAGEAPSTDESDAGAESEAAETEAASDSTSWDGPEWIDYPPGYEMTFSFPIDPERGDGAIYGTVPDSAELPAALDRVVTSFETNGYTIRQAREEYAEVFDVDGGVVLLSTSQFDDPPTLNLVFLTPAEATNRGIVAGSASLEATIGSQSLTATGGCTVTETGNTFVSVDGIQSIGFSLQDDGTQLVQVLLTTADGVDYTTTGGDITSSDASGFTISSGMIGSGGELVEATLTVDCG